MGDRNGPEHAKNEKLMMRNINTPVSMKKITVELIITKKM
tara:strand:+ start:16 stop:135 length:120 start_codon:yes stop_codon:yes gene_type:complete